MIEMKIDAVICGGVVVSCMLILRQIAHGWSLYGWLFKITVALTGISFSGKAASAWKQRVPEVHEHIALDATLLLLLVVVICHHWYKWNRL